MATDLFTFRHKNYENASPVVSGAPGMTVQGEVNFLNSLVSGAASGNVLLETARDQVAATATLADNGLTAADVAGAAINGVNATATYATSVNNTLSLIKNKINGGGDTPNDLISLAAYATRYLTDAIGGFTLDGASGTVAPEVDSTAISFEGTEDNEADAITLAGLINANATAGIKVFAYADGDEVVITAAGTNRATITLSSAAGEVGCDINGIPTRVTYASSDAATATELTAAINANTKLNGLVRAVNSASGVVTIIAITSGDQMPAVGARGTNVTVGGVTTPLTTITVATASGAIRVFINGILIGSVTATGTDATDAAAIASLINNSFVARRYVTATSAAGVCTVASKSGITLAAVGTGATASAAYLTAAGTYGGVAGNALTLTAATGVDRSAATLENGASGLLITATQAGPSGNWITFAAAGAAAAHVTASGARLGASPGGAVVAGAETVETFAFP